MTALDFAKKMGEFMMNMDVYSAHYLLLAEFARLGKAKDYLRMQKVTGIGMDVINTEDLAGLK